MPQTPKSFVPIEQTTAPSSFVSSVETPKSFVPIGSDKPPLNDPGNEGWDVKGTSKATGSTTLTGLGVGVQGMKESFGGSMQMVGSALGIESLRKYGDSVRKAGDEEAARLLPKVTKVEDIRSPSDAMDWLTYTIGTTAPSSAATMAGAGVGFLAGGPVGSLAAAAGISWLLNAGDLYSDLVKEGHDSPKAAAAAGIPMALLDVIMPVKQAGKLVFKPAREAVAAELKKRTVGAALKGVVKEGFKQEALPELGQELIAMGTETAVAEKLPASVLSRAVNSLAGGFVGGTTAGAVTNIAATRMERRRAGEKLVKAPSVEPKVEPVIVQTNTAPLAGPPSPALPVDVQEQQVQTQIAEALPPADIIPELIEPSPEQTVITETETVSEPKTAEPAPVVEEATPQTVTEPTAGGAPLSVTEQPLDAVVGRVREKFPTDSFTPSIVTEFLDRTNQWYASVKRETETGSRVVESVYAPTKKEAEQLLAERVTEKLDLLEAQDENMEALLEASLSGQPIQEVLPPRVPTAPVEGESVGQRRVREFDERLARYKAAEAARVQAAVSAPIPELAELDALERKLGEVEGTLRQAMGSREVPVGAPPPTPGPLAGLPEKPAGEGAAPGKLYRNYVTPSALAGLMQGAGLETGTEGPIAALVDVDKELGMPSEPGRTPREAIVELVVNDAGLKQRGIVKPQIIATAQALGIPLRFESSQKKVEAYLDRKLHEKNLSRIQKNSSEAGFVRLDMLDLWTLTKELARKIQTKAPELPKDQVDRTQLDITKFGRFSENALHLIQIAEQNPGILPLQKYLGKVREFWTSKTKITRMADSTLRVWNNLSSDQFKNLSLFVKDLSDISFKEKRRLEGPELTQLAVKYRLSEGAFEVYGMIDSDLRAMFAKLEENIISDMQKREQDPIARAVAEGMVRQEFEELRNRNFFPVSHFGPNVVQVRAKEAIEHQGRRYRKGQLVEMSTFETEKQRDKRLVEAHREYPSSQFDVKKDLLSDEAAALRGFPSSVFKSLINEARLALKEASLLEEEWKDPPSEGNLVRSLKKGRTVRGFSADTQRMFANFFAEGSNYVARMEHRWDLEGAVREINDLADAQPSGNVSQTRKLYYAMKENYESLMNPKDDWSHLRGWLFPYFFALVPKQAFVNLTQIPMLAYPYLAATYKAPGGVSDAIVLKELTKAALQVGRMFDWESKEFHITSQDEGLLQAVKDATESGLLNESYATEVAGIAHGNVVRRIVSNSAIDHKVRQYLEMATKPFSVSEQFNRHTTFVAAYNLGKKMGLDQKGAFEYAREAVEKTMFEYARWNKPKVLKTKASVILALQTFKMNALYFYGTQPGRGRALGIMLAMGGLMGLPFMEDLLDLLNLAGTWWKEFVGSKNPRVDLETDARELLAAWHLDPDLFMNGLAQSSFGLHKLGSMVGVPIPAVDISPSIQLGRVVPGLKPVTDILQGVGDPSSNILRFVTEASGVAGTTGMNAARAMMDDSVEGMAALKYTMPAFIRNARKAWEYGAKGAALNSRGEKLVEFDLHNVSHQAEILGQLMGFTPTRVSQMQARKWAQAQASSYYNTRRELMFNEYARAMASEDKKERGQARLALREYNRTMPPQFRITGEELSKSVETRNKNEMLRNKGLPTQKRYIQLYRSFEKAYPVSP